MKTIFTKLTVMSVLLFFANIGFAQFDWNMSAGSSCRRSFVSQEEELKPPLKIDAEIPGYYASVISVKNNILYMVMDSDPNVIIAYDVINKKELWSFNISGSKHSVQTTPAISDSTVFTGGQGGDGLFAIDIKTGKQKWLKPLGNLFGRSPVLDNYGHLYIVQDSLYCLDVKTGATIWTFDAGAQISPSVKNDTLFISDCVKFYALNANTGDIIWSKDLIYGCGTQYPVDNQAVYNSYKYLLTSYDIKTGDEKWQYRYDLDYTSAEWYDTGNMCLTDSVVCVSLVSTDPGRNMIVAFNKFSGEKLWEHLSGQYIYSPVAANGIIYVTTGNSLFGFNQTTGDIVFKDDHSRNYSHANVIANHKLYSSTMGKILIFKSVPTSADDISNETNDFKVYPNPVKNNINISYKLKSSEKIKFELFDFAGNKVYELQISENAGVHNQLINVEKYKPGVYYLKYSNNKISKSEKILILRD